MNRTPPPICCTGVPVRRWDGALVYKCGHVYRVLLRLRGEDEAPQKKPVARVKVRKEAA